MKKILTICIFFCACSYSYQPVRTQSVNDLGLSQIQIIKVTDIEYNGSGRNLVTRDSQLRDKIKKDLSNYFKDQEIVDKSDRRCGKGVSKLSTQFSSFKSEPANSELVIYMNLLDCQGLPVWHGSYVVRENDRINNIAGGATPQLKISNVESLLDSGISSLIEGLKQDFQKAILK